jgi:hypothetical protein
MGSYLDALNKDIARLKKDAEELSKKMKSGDKKSQEAYEKLRPFMKEESLKKRFELAAKLDAAELNQTLKKLFPNM